MIRATALLVLLLAPALAGCLGATNAAGGDAPPDPEALTPAPADVAGGETLDEAPPSDAAPEAVQATSVDDEPALGPIHEQWDMPNCVDAGVAFHVPTVQVQAFLPDGFVAEPAVQTYERFASGAPTVGPATDLAERSLVVVLPHYCPTTTMSEGRMDETWVWIGIEPPNAVEGLEPAPVDVYELTHAGGPGGILELKRAVGWSTFGDSVEPAELRGATTGYAMEGATHDGERTVFAYSVGSGVGTPLTVDGPIRVWHKPSNGIAYMDLDITTGPVEVVAAAEIACTMAPGTPAAEITGATSCDDAAAAGLAPSGLMNPPHDVAAAFHFLPSDGSSAGG